MIRELSREQIRQIVGRHAPGKIPPQHAMIAWNNTDLPWYFKVPGHIVCTEWIVFAEHARTAVRMFWAHTQADMEETARAYAKNAIRIESTLP